MHQNGDGTKRMALEVPNQRDVQMLDALKYLASLVLELERLSHARAAADPQHGMIPLIGSSAVIHARDRITRVAATDFTIMIEGGIGPHPHPIYV